MDELINFEKVGYYYRGSDTPALSEVSFSIKARDYLAIVGTSGSGKSTLMSILGLINKPTSGTYRLLSTDVNTLTERSIALLKNREIGFIYQNFNLLSHMTVEQNVTLPLVYNTEIKRQEYKEKALSVLSLVEMDSFIDRYPGQLSGGQQQRIAIARAIINSPSLLLADEPTGNLDSKTSESIFNILDSLNDAGTTICLITHDKSHAKRASRQLTITDGRLDESY